MSFIGDLVGGLFGIDDVSVSDEAVETIDEDEDSTAATRAKLLATAGGQSGAELTSGSTSTRTTLLGN